MNTIMKIIEVFRLVGVMVGLRVVRSVRIPLPLLASVHNVLDDLDDHTSHRRVGGLVADGIGELLQNLTVSGIALRLRSFAVEPEDGIQIPLKLRGQDGFTTTGVGLQGTKRTMQTNRNSALFHVRVSRMFVMVMATDSPNSG